MFAHVSHIASNDTQQFRDVSRVSWFGSESEPRITGNITNAANLRDTVSLAWETRQQRHFKYRDSPRGLLVSGQILSQHKLGKKYEFLCWRKIIV